MPGDRKRKREGSAQPTMKRKHSALSQHGAGESSEDAIDSEEQDSNSGNFLEDDEHEDWAGLSDVDGQPVDGTSTRTGTVPRKPPTGQELRKIKDAADLYMSNSFKLKIDALLPKVRPQYARFAPLEKFLHTLRSLLASLPEVAPQHPLTASHNLLKSGVAVPYPSPGPSEDSNWKVLFQKPQSISLVGGWITKLLVKKKDGLPYVIDLAVEMPDSMFQEKDYLNNRFFHKRAYYLATIAAALVSASHHKPAKKDQKKGQSTQENGNLSFNVDLGWQSVRGDLRTTSLIIDHRPDGSVHDFSGLNARVRIIATLSPTSPIQLSRLSPQRSNIRTEESKNLEVATPIYNSTLLMHITTRSHLLKMHKLQKDVPAFGDALALLKVWANQRGYGESSVESQGAEGQNSSMGSRWTIQGFEGMSAWWVAVLDYLVNGGEVAGKKRERRRPLGHSLSSYQLFRAALDFFSKHDWSEGSVFLKHDIEDARFSVNDFEAGERAVLVDLVSGVNFLAAVPLTSLEMLKHDAQVTLETLSDNNISTAIYDTFDELFLTDKRSLQTRFDVVVRISLADIRWPPHSDHLTYEQGSSYNAILATMSSVLRAGLGNRVKALALLLLSSATRQIYDPAINCEATVHVGIILNTEYAYRLVDYGPPVAAEDSEVEDPHREERAKFRTLWGPKAELRRFKDGRILESVVWEVSTVDERAHIPYLICQYLLKRHCGIGIESMDAVRWTGGTWDDMLKVNGTIAQVYQAAKVEMGFKAAMSAFDGLVKTLKSLDDELPLAILNVSPVSPLLRYTNVFSPVAIPPTSSLLASSSSVTLPVCARYVPLIDIVIEFEKSGRWPDDLKAIQKVKLAFLEAIAVSLGNKINGLQAQIVLEDGQVDSIRDTARLEILTPEGWAFSARIWHDREATLLDDLIDDKPHVPSAIKRALQKNATSEEIRMKHSAIRAKDVYMRRYIHGPRHHRAVAALSHRFSAYTGTVRLVKRWLASHWLLGGHIQEEAVELLCAAMFLTSQGSPKGDGEKQKASVPQTKERGFALVVLFLARWEWESGLFVPIYGNEADDGTSNGSAVESSSAGRRAVWAIKTEQDSEGCMWTIDGPDAVVARRVTDVAKATWNSLRAGEGSDWDVKSIFLHPLTHYDFIVNIDPSKAPRYFHSVVLDEKIWRQKGRYANASRISVDGDISLVPGFDPVQLLFIDIQRTYKETLKVFCDPYGGTAFGIVFDPTLQVPRPFRVRSGYNSTPLAQEGKVKDKDKTLVTLNIDAIMSEIGRMGSELISEIVTQK